MPRGYGTECNVLHPLFLSLELLLFYVCETCVLTRDKGYGDTASMKWDKEKWLRVRGVLVDALLIVGVVILGIAVTVTLLVFVLTDGAPR